jgi:hypothetical protein
VSEINFAPVFARGKTPGALFHIVKTIFINVQNAPCLSIGGPPHAGAQTGAAALAGAATKEKTA